MAKKSQGARNKRKGSDAERVYAKFFRELGFKFCITARQGSRRHDDAGIDLINIPLNVQIKAGKQRGMNPSKELHYVKERVKELFPPDAPEHNNPIILIHRKEVKESGEGKGRRKRNEFDDVVSMSIQDFRKLLNKIQWE
jgi:hypothetical protein